MINKYYIKERFLYDLDRELLHDLKSTINPENRDCALEKISRPLLFDCNPVPAEGKTIKIKTPGGKRKLPVQRHCPACLSPADRLQ